MGLEPIFGPYQWRAGPGLFLTFWRSLGGSVGEQAVLKKKKHVLITSSGKKLKKCVSLSDNAISNPLARRKILLVLAKCLKPPILTHFLFHRIGYFGTPNFPVKNAHLSTSALCDCSVSIVSWDEDDDIMNSCGTNCVLFHPLTSFEVNTRTILEIF